jgi:hypothetical protein
MEDKASIHEVEILLKMMLNNETFWDTRVRSERETGSYYNADTVKGIEQRHRQLYENLLTHTTPPWTWTHEKVRQMVDSIHGLTVDMAHYLMSPRPQ